MTPEELQKEWFRLFNESMKSSVFDKTGVTSKDTDDFIKLNMIRMMDPSNWTSATNNPIQEGLKDNFKIQMKFAIEAMKVQIAFMENLLKDTGA